MIMKDKIRNIPAIDREIERLEAHKQLLTEKLKSRFHHIDLQELCSGSAGRPAGKQKSSGFIQTLLQDEFIHNSATAITGEAVKIAARSILQGCSRVFKRKRSY